MNFDHVFIITYGRSGSTLLQGVLNSVDGVDIKGENDAALRHLFQAWLTAKSASEHYGPVSNSPTDPWYGIGNIDLDGYGRMLAESFVRCVLRPGTRTKVAGFKEIRYFPGSTSTLDEEMEFMRSYFPRAAFVINTRNLADTITSSKKAGHGVSEDEIIGSDLRLREIVAREHTDVWHTHYDDYKQNPEHLRGLFTFLGIPFDLEAVQEVFSRTHSSVTSARQRA